MRKLIFLIPLLLAPALGSAAHQGLPVQPAYNLKIAATDLYWQVSHLRGNKLLKREARQFLRASNQLLRKTRRAGRPHQVARSLDKLNYQFRELKYAVINANSPPWVRKKLRRQLRGIALAINKAERVLARNGRYARSWSRSGYAAVVANDARSNVRNARRYRN